MSDISSEFHWNFLPWRATLKKRDKRQMMKVFFKTLCLGLGTVVLLHFTLLLMLHLQNARNNELHHSLNTLKPLALTTQNLQQQTLALQSHVAMIQKITPSQKPSITLLTLLPKIMPDGVYLTAIALQQNQVTLTGRAETVDQINTLIANMQPYTIFQHPQLSDTHPDDTTPPYHYAFTLQVNLGTIV